MSKAVFIASSHSQYDDRPGEVYHFPSQYLSRVAQTVGDWVIFYEGRRGGNRGYYEVQRVERLVPDPSREGHYFALLDSGSRLTFEQNVPRLKADGHPYETGLPASRGANSSAVRLISDSDFAAILDAGLREVVVPDAYPRTGALPQPGLNEPAGDFHHPGLGPERDMVISNRAFRDRSFARQVKRAYAARCAMSGLALRNGGGRPEVEAAHIVPVEERGPDAVQNGLALSGTLHWMFDRGLVSVAEDHTILCARDSLADDAASRLLTPDRRLILPQDPYLRPHPAYLEWHRTHRFKG